MSEQQSTNPDPSVKEGFMCRTDFEVELDSYTPGTKIYPDLESLQSQRPCIKTCGWVKVRIEKIE